jgi:hypothetical protein
MSEDRVAELLLRHWDVLGVAGVDESPETDYRTKLGNWSPSS